MCGLIYGFRHSPMSWTSSIMIPICKRSREAVLERIFAGSIRDVVTASCGVFAVRMIVRMRKKRITE